MEPINLAPSHVEFVAAPTSQDGNDVTEIAAHLKAQAESAGYRRRYLFELSFRAIQAGTIERRVVWTDEISTALILCQRDFPSLFEPRSYTYEGYVNLSRTPQLEDRIFLTY